MQLSRFLFIVAFPFLPLCLLSTTWLYLYPLFHGCAFPVPEALVPAKTPTPSHIPSSPLFRLLALGDPQLEGDSSLPDPDAPAFPSLQYLASDLRNAGSWKRGQDLFSGAIRDALKTDLPKWLEGYRKIVDLWGNDYYLAHIVRQLRWWTRPTHVAVLGDLLGSQWVSDVEFERRAERYWKIVFRGMEKVETEIMGDNEDERRKWGGTLEILGQDKSWENKVINIVGNHDIGYAGDLDKSRMERFERAFGRANWDIWFELPKVATSAADDTEGESEDNVKPTPALRLAILNSMNLDTPALTESLQHETYEYMNHIITSSRPVTDKTHATILLTHIPLHKEEGICVDSPFFDYFDDDTGVKEQNMLSEHASKIVLENLFGLSGNTAAEGNGFGRRGIIINGHDHEGCDVLHYISRNVYSSPSIPLPPSNIPDISYTSSANATDVESPDENPESRDSFQSPIEDPESPDSSPSPEPTEPSWRALRYNQARQHLHNSSAPFLECSTRSETGSCVSTNPIPHIRELTLRSMMGDFSGYAGFLSAWFDSSLGEEGEWRIEFSECGVGVQHWWWAVHILDLVVVAIILVGVIVRIGEGFFKSDGKDRKRVAGVSAQHKTGGANRIAEKLDTGAIKKVNGNGTLASERKR
ncbi:hypothetical protein B0J11DRAFT_544522 [Dendryphion nanum]|uniref:Uncharacterized protein n=1 Tax=Dendryphion nanum TaxID=256645 RepID=A0A9P9I7Z2_9PLEO|nr:hypothetical protein B0J11DRAFT_544522 [Dendryphion nanum]